MPTVQVYPNRSKGGFSIRDKRTKRVIDHAHVVVLDDAIFKASCVEGERSEDIPAGFEDWTVAELDERPGRRRRVVMAAGVAYLEE